eukprot:scaffold318486_cov32-Tisochrysis_lutea.AAC.1
MACAFLSPWSPRLCQGDKERRALHDPILLTIQGYFEIVLDVESAVVPSPLPRGAGGDPCPWPRALSSAPLCLRLGPCAGPPIPVPESGRRRAAARAPYSWPIDALASRWRSRSNRKASAARQALPCRSCNCATTSALNSAHTVGMWPTTVAKMGASTHRSSSLTRRTTASGARDTRRRPPKRPRAPRPSHADRTAVWRAAASGVQVQPAPPQTRVASSRTKRRVRACAAARDPVAPRPIHCRSTCRGRHHQGRHRLLDLPVAPPLGSSSAEARCAHASASGEPPRGLPPRSRDPIRPPWRAVGREHAAAPHARRGGSQGGPCSNRMPAPPLPGHWKEPFGQVVAAE